MPDSEHIPHGRLRQIAAKAMPSPREDMLHMLKCKKCLDAFWELRVEYNPLLLPKSRRKAATASK